MAPRAPLLLLLLLAGLAAGAAAQCTTTPVVLNGRFPGLTLPVAEGTSLTATCNFRYTSLPVPTATCTGGAWVYANGACQRVCGSVPPVPEGATYSWPESCLGTPQLGWCKASCPEGLTGSPAVQCLGQWGTVIGQCVEGPACAGQPGAVVRNGRWQPCQDTPVGWLCFAECNTNYYPLAGGAGPMVECVADENARGASWSSSIIGECGTAAGGGNPGGSSGGSTSGGSTSSSSAG